MPPPRLRFAPSPTGPVHLGSAVVAVANAPGRARPRRRAGAAHRRHRCRADGRGRRAGDPRRPRLARDRVRRAPPVRQSERREQHLAAAEHLLATAHAYRCFCPPSEERYDGRCRAIPRADAERRHDAGEAERRSASACRRARSSSTTRHAGRCASPATRSPTSCSCARTGGPTFDLATAVDDRDLEITHIVRGEDHLANSARHLLVLRALGAPEPVFAHCPIIVGADGERLSTRRGAEPLSLAARARRAARGRRRLRCAAGLPGAGRSCRGRAVRRARAALLARAARARHGARRSGASGLDGTQRPGTDCRSRSWRAVWRRSCRRARRSWCWRALAEAARGASALGEVADSAAALAQDSARPAA